MAYLLSRDLFDAVYMFTIGIPIGTSTSCSSTGTLRTVIGIDTLNGVAGTDTAVMYTSFLGRLRLGLSASPLRLPAL